MSGEALTVDGVSMKHFATNITSLGATLRSPGRRGANAAVAGRSGSIWTPGKPHEDGGFVWDMWLLGCLPDGTIPSGSNATREFFARVNELTALLGNDGYGRALHDVRHTQPDGSVRRANCEVISLLDFSTTGANPIGMLSVEWVNPGAYWSDVSEQSVTLGGTDAASRPGIFAGATAPMDDCSIAIKGAITNPRITDLVTGAWFQYNAALTSSQTLTVNCADWTLTGSGITPDYSKVQFFNTSGRLMRFAPDPVQRGYRMQFSGSSSSGATAIVTGTRKYLVG